MILMRLHQEETKTRLIEKEQMFSCIIENKNMKKKKKKKKKHTKDQCIKFMKE